MSEKKPTNQRRIRRRACQNLEDLSCRCLQPAALALLGRAQFDSDLDLGVASGELAVSMAKTIRLACARETASVDDAELAILAEETLDIREAKGEPN